MAKKPETLFKERVQRDLKKIKNVWYYKTQEISRCGIPDIIACYKGNFIAMELKVDSPIDRLQIYNIDKINNCGGLAYIVTPENWKLIYKTVFQGE